MLLKEADVEKRGIHAELEKKRNSCTKRMESDIKREKGSHGAGGGVW